MNEKEKIAFQNYVRQVLVDLGKELHYLLDKPVEEWDEYDQANWKNILAQYKSPLSRFEMQELVNEIRKRLNESPGLVTPVQELIEWYNKKIEENE